MIWLQRAPGEMVTRKRVMAHGYRLNWRKQVTESGQDVCPGLLPPNSSQARPGPGDADLPWPPWPGRPLGVVVIRLHCRLQECR